MLTKKKEHTEFKTISKLLFTLLLHIGINLKAFLIPKLQNGGNIFIPHSFRYLTGEEMSIISATHILSPERIKKTLFLYLIAMIRKLRHFFFLFLTL